MMLADVNKEDLTLLADLMQSGKVTPVIDKTYPFSEIREAVRYVETGRARGKVAVTLADAGEISLAGGNAAKSFWEHDRTGSRCPYLHRRPSCRVDRAHHHRARSQSSLPAGEPGEAALSVGLLL